MKSLVIIILMFFSLNSYADCPIDEFVGKYKVVRAFCWQSDNGNYKEYIPENIPETIEIRRVSDDSAEVWRDNYGFSYNINSSKNNDLYVCKNTQNVKKVTSYLCLKVHVVIFLNKKFIFN